MDEVGRDIPAHEPPSYPPPILTDSQLFTLSHQGHLSFRLSIELAKIISSLGEVASRFFAQSTEFKTSTYPPSNGTELGYYNIPGEKEYLTLRYLGNDPVSGLEKLAASTWSCISSLLHRVLVGISHMLKIRPESWDPILDGCLDMPANAEDMTPTLLRIFRYEPNSGIADRHTDSGLLTLCVGSEPGLQVWQKSTKQEESGGGYWVDAEGPTILIGRTLRLLSSNRVTAGLHRVVGNPTGRGSIVFALRPSLRHEIDLSLLGGWGAVSASDMWSKVSRSRVNVNTVKHVRDQQKLDLRKERQTIESIVETGA